MAFMEYELTKSKYCMGLQCPKILWRMRMKILIPQLCWGEWSEQERVG